jgi:hypothetical protein
VSGPFDFSSDFGGLESWLFQDAFGTDFHDATAEALYHAAYFERNTWDPEQLSTIRETLNSYMMDEYGVDFEEQFDWDAWREAYA